MLVGPLIDNKGKLRPLFHAGAMMQVCMTSCSFPSYILKTASPDGTCLIAERDGDTAAAFVALSEGTRLQQLCGSLLPMGSSSPCSGADLDEEEHSRAREKLVCFLIWI